ncbi:MAG: metallophosphoesterase family protein [Halanaeroarchaeum sp.]
MRLAVISDTHIPEREAAMPAAFRDRIRRADHTIHAGDVQTAAVLEEVRELAGDLTAVHGNLDPAALPAPAVADLTVEDVTFVVTHGAVNPVEAAVYGHDGMAMTADEWANAIGDTARARTRNWDGEGLVGIGGHTHQVEDMVHEGVRLLNPGSATGADPAEEATMMTVDIDGDEIDVTRHRE